VEIIFVLLLALIIDVTWGELPRSFHPVVGMGKFTSVQLRFAPRQSHLAQLVYGAAILLLTVGLFSAAAYFLLSYLKQINLIVYILVAALLLKSTFSVKELERAATRVKEHLLEGNLQQARTEMRSLVSRDPSDLGKSSLVAATVESVAENTCDSFVAPLFYFLFLGVPGAIAYRVCNTLDAMIGYHGEYEYLGKLAARVDDVLNFIPARLAALMMVTATYLSRKDMGMAWRIMLRDHDKTESPNAGWTIGAAAGALHVQLEKVEHYRLGDARASLSPQTISGGVEIMKISVLLWASICLIVEVMSFVFAA
jgi:adenosylcobinamide-phosphate synthase